MCYPDQYIVCSMNSSRSSSGSLSIRGILIAYSLFNELNHISIIWFIVIPKEIFKYFKVELLLFQRLALPYHLIIVIENFLLFQRLVLTYRLIQFDVIIALQNGHEIVNMRVFGNTRRLLWDF